MADFSVVIPTRRRPKTFLHAFATALAQDDPGVEIVVQNNGADAETRAIVERAADPRVVYAETPDVLPMTENWERALDQVSGSYVLYIGDDDGILPDACAYLRAVTAASPEATVISWAPPDYGWPDAAPKIRDRLVLAELDDRKLGATIGSADMLAKVYDYSVRFITVPSIYHGCTHISVIRRMRALFGSYFATALPDLYSGIINLLATPAHFRSQRPLTVRGTSGASTGAAFSSHVQGAAKRAEFERDNAGRIGGWETGLFPADNEEMVVANAMLAAKAKLFPGDRGPPFDFHGLIRTMIRGLPEDPDGYDAKLADVRRLAAMHGVTVDESRLPGRHARMALMPGIMRVEGVGTLLVVDCERAKIRTVADAVTLASGLYPRWR